MQVIIRFRKEHCAESDAIPSFRLISNLWGIRIFPITGTRCGCWTDAGSSHKCLGMLAYAKNEKEPDAHVAIIFLPRQRNRLYLTAKRERMGCLVIMTAEKRMLLWTRTKACAEEKLAHSNCHIHLYWKGKQGDENGMVVMEIFLFQPSQKFWCLFYSADRWL